MNNDVPRILRFNSNEKNDEHIEIQIPECCREGWDSCPHSAKRKDTKRKRNVGL